MGKKNGFWVKYGNENPNGKNLWNIPSIFTGLAVNRNFGAVLSRVIFAIPTNYSVGNSLDIYIRLYFVGISRRNRVS